MNATIAKVCLSTFQSTVVLAAMGYIVLLNAPVLADHPGDNQFFQAAGADFMAFEAEAGHITDTDLGTASIWRRVEDPGNLPSEGFILRPSANFTGGAPASTSTFVLDFLDNSDPYHLYVRSAACAVPPGRSRRSPSP